MKIAYLQPSEGRRFIIENAFPSLAWKMHQGLIRLGLDRRVFKTVFDQCRFDLRGEFGFHRKRTQFLTSMRVLHDDFNDRRCLGKHLHQPVIGGSKITAPAGRYPPAMANAIVRSAGTVEAALPSEVSCSRDLSG